LKPVDRFPVHELSAVKAIVYDLIAGRPALIKEYDAQVKTPEDRRDDDTGKG
jgi:hypothetical protein